MNKYKVTIGKVFITVSPKPTKFIRDGLKIEYDKETGEDTIFATTDLIVGKQRYLRPDYKSHQGRAIVKGYVV